jgi:bacteriocin-like protein
MKKLEENKNLFTEMNKEELTKINGGSFAYDLGRLIRYMAIYVSEGTGVRGNMYAYTDFVTNMVVNNM